MASRITIMMRSKTDETEEIRKACYPPANCDGLSAVRVNNEVWSRISANAKHKDLKMQNIGNFLMAGTTHFANLIDGSPKLGTVNQAPYWPQQPKACSIMRKKRSNSWVLQIMNCK